MADLRTAGEQLLGILTSAILLQAAGTSRDLTTDAQIAAYALENRGVVHTADGDFSRFPGVRSIDPLTE